ncbi:MAG: hypothetical protein Tsb0019_03770 [Roseibium sp.]
MTRTSAFTGAVFSLTRRKFLAGLLASAGFPALTQPLGAIQGTATLRYGWRPDAAAPTRATYYVAPSGKDSNPGTLKQPFRTIQRGVDALSQEASGSLAIRGGTYREAVSLENLRGDGDVGYRVHRYGAETVTITAAEPLTGWVPVPAEEATRLGTSSEGLFKTNLALDQIEHGSIHALNIHQDGKWCPPSTDISDDLNPASLRDPGTFHEADFLLDADGRIQAVRDPRLTALTAEQLRQARVLLYHRPNMVSSVDIAGFDLKTGIIDLSDTGYKPHTQGKTAVMRYALTNVGRDLFPGQWIARETMPGTITVYLRPFSVESLEAGVEYSARSHCIDLGTAQNTELLGLNAIRASGEKRYDGICIRRLSATETSAGLKLTNCRAGENFSAGERGYGAMFLRGTEGLTLRSLTIDQSRNSFGLAVFDANGTDMRLLHIANVSQSPARFFTLRNAVLAFSLFENSALDAHANKFNFYEGSDNVLVYGIKTHRVGGYATFQEASRIHFAFCNLSCDAAARGRALVSQNRRPGAGQGGPDGSGEPVSGAVSYIWNNCFPPDPENAGLANSLVLGPEDTSQRYAIFNNILHGGGFVDIYRKHAAPDRETRAGNRYTGYAFWQSKRYGWHLDDSEAALTAGSVPLARGIDMRPVIQNELAPAFPGFTDWDKDIDGKPVNWESPPIGCRDY